MVCSIRLASHDRILVDGFIFVLYHFYTRLYIYINLYTKVPSDAICRVAMRVCDSCGEYTNVVYLLGLWLRLECSLDSLSIDSAHVIYVSEGYDVAYNRRTASQPSYVILRVTWYVKTFRNVNYVC